MSSSSWVRTLGVLWVLLADFTAHGCPMVGRCEAGSLDSEEVPLVGTPWLIPSRSPFGGHLGEGVVPRGFPFWGFPRAPCTCSAWLPLWLGRCVRGRGALRRRGCPYGWGAALSLAATWLVGRWLRLPPVIGLCCCALLATAVDGVWGIKAPLAVAMGPWPQGVARPQPHSPNDFGIRCSDAHRRQRGKETKVVLMCYLFLCRGMVCVSTEDRVN